MEPKKKRGRLSRRGFMQGIGAGTGAAGLVASAEAQTGESAPILGPGAVSITLTINGKPAKLQVEPRTTLLDALRNDLQLTGAKRVCDRGTCGACTVMINGKAVYACSTLAIDAQGKAIETIEGFAMEGGKPHPIVDAFVNHDAQQCGYCTPGFVVATKALLKRTPSPTPNQVAAGLGGNLCRCGTYIGMRQAVLEAAKTMGAKGGGHA